MTTAETTKTNTGTAATFNRRLEETGWALFLIMIGALLLLPEGLVPDGTWLVGTGLIMIGMNVVRHLHGLRVSGFTAVLGLVALAGGYKKKDIHQGKNLIFPNSPDEQYCSEETDNHPDRQRNGGELGSSCCITGFNSIHKRRNVIFTIVSMVFCHIRKYLWCCWCLNSNGYRF